MRSGEYSLSESLIYEKFVDISLRAIDFAEQKIKEMEPDIQKVREKLIQASKERMVIERLKERRLREYNVLLNREIARENDDINMNLFNRNVLLEEKR